MLKRFLLKTKKPESEAKADHEVKQEEKAPPDGTRTISNAYPAARRVREAPRPSAVAPKRLGGVDPKVFPEFPYMSPSSGAIEVQCVICVCDFVPGEKVRLLPCLHRYHSACIDPWISGNSHCPTCNADISKLLASSS